MGVGCFLDLSAGLPDRLHLGPLCDVNDEVDVGVVIVVVVDEAVDGGDVC